MMASVDEGVGMLLEALEQTRQLDNTCIVFLGDNGFFCGEHGITIERRFAYEEGIRTAFYVRYRQDGWGRAAYDPAMMVAIVLYAYAKGQRSSRGIERACVEDVASGCK